jgi:energy-coupling factor transporter transmembrane protein EcfT
MTGLFDLYVRQDSPLHRLDTRAKLAATAGFLAGAMCAPTRPFWPALALFALLSAATVAARVPLGMMGKRFVALGLVVGVPFLLSRLGGEATRLAGEGFAVKCLLAAGGFFLLAATTRVSDLLDAACRLPLLASLGALAGFIFRGANVLAEEVGRSMRALALRAPQASRRVRVGGLTAVSISLLGRAAARSERIGAAMALRGFDGHFSPPPARALPVRDLLWGAALGLGPLAIGVVGRWM